MGKRIPEIAPSLARHYVVALEKVLESKKTHLPTRTTIEIVGYYKDLRDMITYNKSERRYRNQRIGHVKGVEVSLDHEIGKAFQGWLSYAYTLSKRQDSPTDDERFYMYNTPHVVTIGMKYQAESWQCSANWQYKNGVLYSPLVDRQPYTNPFTKNKTWLPIYGEMEREAPYHRLDLRVHKSFKSVFNLDKWKWGFTLELWNVYNRRNILQVRYNKNYTKEIRIAQLPLIPFVAVTAEF